MSVCHTGLHNIPEGMAVATVMVSKGAKPGKALFWSLFCAFPQVRTGPIYTHTCTHIQRERETDTHMHRFVRST